MILTFSPIRMDQPLVLERLGDSLIVNGVEHDFSDLPDGAVLPRDAVDSAWLAGDVSRSGGRLHVPVMLPIAATAPEAARRPGSLALDEDGPVRLPDGSVTSAGEPT